MNLAARRTLYWTPRVISIVFAVFISLFALDVFQGHAAPAQVALALAMHLVPTALVVVALVIAWRWEWVGAVLYFGLAVLYVVVMHERARWDWYLLIAGPAVLVGVLFLLGWLFRRELRART